MKLPTAGITLNGLKIGEKYTISQVETSLGIADEKHIRMDESGMSYQLFYGKSIIYFSTDAGIKLFILRDKRFTINELFKIGDPISVLLSVLYCRFEFDNVGNGELYIASGEQPLRITVNNGIITWIGFYSF